MGSWTVSHGEMILNCAATYWYYYPEPDCYTRTVLSRLRDGHSVLYIAQVPVIGSPVIPNKDGIKEPQTVVSPLLGLIGVVY